MTQELDMATAKRLVEQIKAARNPNDRKTVCVEALTLGELIAFAKAWRTEALPGDAMPRVRSIIEEAIRYHCAGGDMWICADLAARKVLTPNSEVSDPAKPGSVAP